MHWLKEAPLGWKFVPTDAELMWGFLYPEVLGGGRWGKDRIKLSDLVYKKPPWEFCSDSTTNYFFTELEKKDQNRTVRTVGSYGNWDGSKRKEILWKNNYINNNNNNGTMGFKRLFKFMDKGEGKETKATDWLMHEFSLPEKETKLVLCVIQKKKKEKEEMGPEFDPRTILVRDPTTSAADRWKEAPLGWKFVPTDAELMWGFPYREVERVGGMGGWGQGPIKFSDQVYKNPPWEFCTDSTAHYFFTELKNKDQNRKVRTVGSYGTWYGSKRKKIPRKNNYINNNNNGNMGFKRLFNFKENGEGKQMKTTGWLMHEFSLPDQDNNLVLCVIQKKKKKKEEEEEMGPASAGGDQCSAPTPAPANDHQALDSEKEQTCTFWLGLPNELPEVFECPDENFLEGDSYAGVEEGDFLF